MKPSFDFYQRYCVVLRGQRARPGPQSFVVRARFNPEDSNGAASSTSEITKRSPSNLGVDWNRPCDGTRDRGECVEGQERPAALRLETTRSPYASRGISMDLADVFRDESAWPVVPRPPSVVGVWPNGGKGPTCRYHPQPMPARRPPDPVMKTKKEGEPTDER